MQKRILILTAGFGEGHNAAARGMRDALAITAADGALVEMHDLFAETFGLLNDWARRAYLAVINRAPNSWERFYHWLDRQPDYGSRMGWLFLAKARLSQLLLRFQPTAVVSVYPAYSYLLESLLADAPASFSRVVCITDSITVNAIWYRGAADLFLVPNEQTATVLAQLGLPDEKVRTTGFPVTPRIAELGELRTAPSPGSEVRILCMINAGGQVAPEIIRGLCRLENVRMTVTVGRDEKLRRKIEEFKVETPHAFEIIGWTDQLPRLMLESHLLISKAGGATVQEAIAAKCPMIVSQVVPGQEEGNARLLESTRSGIVATTPETIVRGVEQALADHARLWREWSQNIAQLSRPRAAFAIADLLLGL